MAPSAAAWSPNKKWSPVNRPFCSFIFSNCGCYSICYSPSEGFHCFQHISQNPGTEVHTGRSRHRWCYQWFRVDGTLWRWCALTWPAHPGGKIQRRTRILCIVPLWYGQCPAAPNCGFDQEAVSITSWFLFCPRMYGWIIFLSDRRSSPQTVGVNMQFIGEDRICQRIW